MFVIPQRSGGICFCRCSCNCSCLCSCPFAAQRRNLLLPLQLQLFLLSQLPFCLSFRSAAEESASAVAVAVAVVLVFAVALLFVIPQRSGGICFCRCSCSCSCLCSCPFQRSGGICFCRCSCSCSCFRSCPFVCHSAAQRRNLLLQFRYNRNIAPNRGFETLKYLVLLGCAFALGCHQKITPVIGINMRRFCLHRVAVILFASACLPALPQKKPCPALETKVPDGTFKPGQVWAYSTRPNEASSTLTILQVDHSEKLGVVVHIRVDGIQMHAPNGNLLTSIGHMPFTRDAILLSTTHLLRTDKTIPTLEGYERWRTDCGGIYTISVRDAVEADEKTLNAP